MNVVLDVVVPSFAVMVTVWLRAGPSLVPNDQVHVPDALVPALTTVPTDAVSVTVSPAFASDQVPLLFAVWPSLTVTVALALGNHRRRVHRIVADQVLRTALEADDAGNAVRRRETGGEVTGSHCRRGPMAKRIVAFGAFALTFAVTLQESPLPMFPVLKPLLSAVPEEVPDAVPPQVVEPVKFSRRAEVLGLADAGHVVDLTLRAPSVNVVCAV